MTRSMKVQKKPTLRKNLRDRKRKAKRKSLRSSTRTRASSDVGTGTAGQQTPNASANATSGSSAGAHGSNNAGSSSGSGAANGIGVSNTSAASPNAAINGSSSSSHGAHGASHGASHGSPKECSQCGNAMILDGVKEKKTASGNANASTKKNLFTGGCQVCEYVVFRKSQRGCMRCKRPNCDFFCDWCGNGYHLKCARAMGEKMNSNGGFCCARCENDNQDPAQASPSNEEDSESTGQVCGSCHLAFHSTMGDENNEHNGENDEDTANDHGFEVNQAVLVENEDVLYNAIITHVDNEQERIKIHFLRWSKSFDNWYAMDDERVNESLACDCCNQWFHIGCLPPIKSSGRFKDTTYVCPDCIQGAKDYHNGIETSRHPKPKSAHAALTAKEKRKEKEKQDKEKHKAESLLNKLPAKDREEILEEKKKKITRLFLFSDEEDEEEGDEGEEEEDGEAEFEIEEKTSLKSEELNAKGNDSQLEEHAEESETENAKSTRTKSNTRAKAKDSKPKRTAANANANAKKSERPSLPPVSSPVNNSQKKRKRLVSAVERETKSQKAKKSPSTRSSSSPKEVAQPKERKQSDAYLEVVEETNDEADESEPKPTAMGKEPEVSPVEENTPMEQDSGNSCGVDEEETRSRSRSPTPSPRERRRMANSVSSLLNTPPSEPVSPMNARPQLEARQENLVVKLEKENFSLNPDHLHDLNTSNIVHMNNRRAPNSSGSSKKPGKHCLQSPSLSAFDILRQVAVQSIGSELEEPEKEVQEVIVHSRFKSTRHEVKEEPKSRPDSSTVSPSQTSSSAPEPSVSSSSPAPVVSSSAPVKTNDVACCAQESFFTRRFKLNAFVDVHFNIRKEMYMKFCWLEEEGHLDYEQAQRLRALIVPTSQAFPDLKFVYLVNKDLPTAQLTKRLLEILPGVLPSPPVSRSTSPTTDMTPSTSASMASTSCSDGTTTTSVVSSSPSILTAATVPTSSDQSTTAEASTTSACTVTSTLSISAAPVIVSTTCSSPVPVAVMLPEPNTPTLRPMMGTGFSLLCSSPSEENPAGGENEEPRVCASAAAPL